MTILRLLYCLLLGIAFSSLYAADPVITSVTPDTGASSTDGITNATTLTVTGTADVGASVVLLFDTVNPPVAQAANPAQVVGISGTFSFTLVTGITSYTTCYLAAKATTTSVAKTLVIDPVATAPVISAISPEIGHPGYTNSATPTFTGTAKPGASVTVYTTTFALAGTTADASGNWSCISSATLAEGAHTFTAQQVDLAGNGPSPFSAAVNVTVDTFNAGLLVNDAPAALVTSATPAFKGFGETGATVSLHNGSISGPVLGTQVITTNPWTLQPASAESDGPYTQYVVSTDLAGNVLTAGPFSYTVDTAAPQDLTLIEFDGPGGVVPLNGTSTIDRILTLSGSVAVLDAGCTVRVFIQGVQVGSATADSHGDWSVTLPSLNDASWTIQATATDLAGNTTAPVSTTLIIDLPQDNDTQRYAPVFLDGLNGGGSLITSSNTPTLPGSAGPNRTVTLTCPNPSWPSPSPVVMTDGNGNWSYMPPSALSDGTYLITATNADGTSTAFTLVVDTVPPSGVTFDSISDDTGASSTDLITNDPLQRLQVSGITDPVPSSGGLTVTAYLYGLKIGSATAVDGSGNALIDLTGKALPEGIQSFTFQANDAAHNTGPMSAPVLVDIDMHNNAPGISAISPDTGRSGSDFITMSSTATALIGLAKPLSSVSVTLNGGTATVIATDSSGVWHLPLPPSSYPDGVYAIQASSIDLAGNLSATTSGTSFTIDNVPPPVPTAIITPDTGVSSTDLLTNVPQLTISGNAEANAFVMVTLTSVAHPTDPPYSKTVTALSGGTYSADFTAITLTDGQWSLAVTATDIAGNVSNPFAAVITIDTSLISPTIGLIVSPGDTGRSASDFRTQDRTPTLTGTASTEGDVVGSTLTLNGVVYPLTVDGSGNWTLPVPAGNALPDGTYTILITTTDTAGNIRTASQALVIDNVAPSAVITGIVTDTGISNSDFITFDTTLVINGTVNESDADVSVDIFDNATGLSVASTSLPIVVRAVGGSWTLNATAIVLSGNPSHDYTIHATPTDAAGNAGALATHALTVNTVAPSGSAVITGYTTDTNVVGDNITMDTVPAFTGTYTAALAGEYVAFKVDGLLSSSIPVSAGAGSWTYNVPHLADGVHTFQVGLEDIAGNIGTLPPATTITVDTATIAPFAITISPDTGHSSSDFVTKTPAFSVTGQAEVGATITVTIGSIVKSAVVDGTGHWSVPMDITALADGPESIVCGVTDVAGNLNSATVAMTLDRVAPLQPVISGITTDTGRSGSDLTTKDRTLLITGTAEANAYVEFYQNGVLQGEVQADSSGNWTYDHTAVSLADGLYAVTVTATDLAGNISVLSAAANVTVDTTAPPTTPVITAITTDSNIVGDFVTNHNALIFSGTSDPGNTIDAYQLQLTITNASSVATPLGFVVPDASGNWTVDDTATHLPDGTYTLTAVSQDLAGNNSAVSATKTLVIDTVAPTITIGQLTTDTGRSSTDYITNLSPTKFVGTTEKNAVVTLTVTLQPSGTPQTASVTATSSGAWTILGTAFSPTPWVEGTYSLSATAEDLAGNTALTPALKTLVIDQTPPVAPVITGFTIDTGSSNSDGITSDAYPVISGTSEASALITLTFKMGATVVRTPTVTATSGGVWTYTPPASPGPALADGTYAITATATDIAGNVSPVSNTLPITVDTTTVVPALTAITPDSNIGGDFVTNGNTLVLTGSAEIGASVVVTLDGTAHTVTADASGVWTANFSALILPDAVYSVTMAATDIAGNTASGSHPVTVDTTAPLAPTLKVIPDTGPSPTDGLTNATTISVGGTGEPGARLTVSIPTLAGFTTTTVTVAVGGTWTLALPATVAEGSYLITTTQMDLAGNVSPATTLTMTVDRTIHQPTLTRISNDSGASSSDLVTNDHQPSFIGTGTADPHTTVIVHIGSTILAGVTSDGSGNWTAIPAAPLADGSYAVTLYGTDPAGNTVGPGATSTLVIDTTPPLVPVIASISTDTNVPGDFITKDNTLLVAGTAEANATLTFTIAGYAPVTITVSGTGTWSYDDTATTLPDGSYLLTASATDLAGNISPMASTTLVVDTVAPAAPVITGFGIDTGVVGDHITSDTTPVLSGTAEAGAVVQVTIDGVVVGTTTANGSGIWSYASPILADGPHAFTTTATDIAGNVSSVSTAYAITVDTSTPAPTLTAITTDSNIVGDFITNDPNLTLAGTAEAGSTVVVTLDGQTRTVTATSGGTWTADFTGVTLPDGPYSVGMAVTDPAGNTNTGTHALTIDTTPPLAPTLAISPDTGSSSTDGVTNATSISVDGTGEPGAQLTVSIPSLAGFTPTTVTVTVGGTWTLPLAGTVPEGSYLITTVQMDLAGNSSPATTLTMTVDRTLAQPTLTGISIDSGASANDLVTNDNRPTFLGVGSADPNSSVIVHIGSIVLPAVTSDGSGNWSATPLSNLLDGTYAVTLYGADPAGNAVGPGTASTLVIDTVAPAAPVITAISDDTGIVGDFITNDQTLLISGTAEAFATVAVSISGEFLGTTTANASGAWTFDATATTLPQNTYTIDATATDLAGNTSVPGTHSLIVDVGIGAPAVSIVGLTPATDSGVAGDDITNAATPVLTGFATPGATVTVDLQGGGTVGTALVNGSGVWTLDLPGLAEGTYTYTASSVDVANNANGPSSPLAITIDRSTPAPTVDAITADTGTPGDFLTNDTTPVIHGTAEAGATLTVSLRGVVVGTAVADSSGAWMFPCATLLDGSYAISVLATDIAGNTASDASNRTLVIDTTIAVPVITALVIDSSVPGDFVTDDGSPFFTGTADPGVSIAFSIDGLLVATVMSDGGGAWQTPNLAISDGVHQAVAVATDAAGNQATSLTQGFTIDTQMATPVISGFAPDSGAVGDGITDTGAITITGSGEPGASLAITVDGTVVGTITIPSSGQWSYLFAPPLADGTHAITVAATDLAGNTATSNALSVTVDTLAPAAPVISQITDATGVGGGGGGPPHPTPPPPAPPPPPPGRGWG